MKEFKKYCDDHNINLEKITPIARHRLLYTIDPEMRESCKKMIGMWLESYDRHDKELQEIQKKLKKICHRHDLEEQYFTVEMKKKEAMSYAIYWATLESWESNNVDVVKETLLAHKKEYIEYYNAPKEYDCHELYRGNNF